MFTFSLPEAFITLFIGMGIPIPILDEEMARFTGVRDKDIVTNIVDYAVDYPEGTGKILGEVSYEELRSGTMKRSRPHRFRAIHWPLK